MFTHCILPIDVMSESEVGSLSSLGGDYILQYNCVPFTRTTPTPTKSQYPHKT